jgi:hypothetical protein
LTNVLIRNGIKCYGKADARLVETRDVRASKDVNIVANVVKGDFRRVRVLLRRRALMEFLRKVVWKSARGLATFLRAGDGKSQAL